jgi:hypothetical protein
MLLSNLQYKKHTPQTEKKINVLTYTQWLLSRPYIPSFFNDAFDFWDYIESNDSTITE